MYKTSPHGLNASGYKAKGGMRTIKPSKPGQKPISYRPGGLHRSLGVPAGKPIPKSKLRAALAGKYGPKAKKQAAMAHNVFHVSAKRKAKGKKPC